ncbi:YhzD family protein [Bacillus sp. 2205SS5-2]|uniref:YhzD family protein n=1 Tax=Bacillus sp. 2205SS5-2 TaxID=3109031 RepID=UPI0030043836
MNVYKLTVFEKNGEKILEENVNATDDSQAKQLGAALVEEKGFAEKTHRFTSPKGKLLLFHV